MLRSLYTLLTFIFLNITSYAQSPHVFSKEESHEKKILEKAIFLLNSNQIEKAYIELHQQLKVLKTPYGKTSTKLLLSNYFTKKSMWDSSTYYIEKALLSGEKFTNDSLKNRLFAFSYRQLGMNYSNQGNFGEAKKMYIKGLETTLKYSEQWLYYAITHQLSLVYSRTKEYDNALQGFMECLNYRDDPELLYGSYINIGDIYTYKKDYTTSNEYLLKAKSLCEEENNLYGQSVILTSLAHNYHEQGNRKIAFALYADAVQIADSISHEQAKIIAKSGMGIILAEEYQNYRKAKGVLHEALNKAVKYNHLSEQRTIYDYLKQVSVYEKNYKEALYYSTLHYAIHDSIVKMQQNKEISTLEIEYQTHQKEKKIELLKKDKQLQALEIDKQKIIIVSFFILMPILLLLAFQYRQKLRAQKGLHQKQRVINEKNITALMKEQELKLMEASIEGTEKERERIAQELHDSIGSNLAAIKLQLNQYEKPKTNKLDSIQSQIDETYQQVRELSHSLVPKQFGDYAFCDVLKNYMYNIDQASELKTTLLAYPEERINEVDEKIKIETFKIIQELITNVFKHAEATKIELQLNLLDDIFNIILEDNGCGFNTDLTNNGIGLNNINKRLNTLSGSFDIDSRPQRGTIINIEIPLTSHNKA